MNTRKTFLNALLVLLLLSPCFLFGQDIQTKAVKFAKGKSSAVIPGSVKGYQTIDYVVGAIENQTLKVNLKTTSSSLYFNVLPPGSNDEAIFVGSNEGKSFAGSLSKSGNYKIRVYLMRNEARRGTTAKYTLNVEVK